MYSGPRLESNHPPSSSFAPCKRRACYQPNNSHLFFYDLGNDTSTYRHLREYALWREKKKEVCRGDSEACHKEEAKRGLSSVSVQDNDGEGPPSSYNHFDMILHCVFLSFSFHPESTVP